MLDGTLVSRKALQTVDRWVVLWASMSGRKEVTKLVA